MWLKCGVKSGATQRYRALDFEKQKILSIDNFHHGPLIIYPL